MKIFSLLAACVASLPLLFNVGQAPAEKKALAVGADAPVFHLNDHTGKTVKIGGEQDTWTILAFYPKALTPG
jgi:hypothetical protein